ncbi:MAG: carboxymethylenebutenolidase [Rhodospirillaceae bacterium]|nr:carboxymethylenebutenolidase [Rhodospirillaceae bacterium]|tara:strand:+ start:87 stop:764 length:678 start_codon:yes stop_codon:yes gene_type:complete
MGETIKLRAADDHELDAYRAPASGRPRCGLVVVQEIFGVNSHIRSVADGFAAEGYEVLAPALFDRVERGADLTYEEPDRTHGRELKAKVQDHEALMDIQAAITDLRARDGIYDVGVVGYCWGGLLAWLSATRMFGVSVAVGYYGGGIAKALDKNPRCPVMLHFGEKDTMIPMEDVEQVRAAFPDIPIHVYPAGHGFNCDDRASYDAESAALARDRTLKFLAEHMG